MRAGRRQGNWLQACRSASRPDDIAWSDWRIVRPCCEHGRDRGWSRSDRRDVGPMRPSSWQALWSSQYRSHGRPSHRLAPVPCDARSMLMHADNWVIWRAASWAAASASMIRPRYQPAATGRIGYSKWCMGQMPPADHARVLLIATPRRRHWGHDGRLPEERHAAYWAASALRRTIHSRRVRSAWFEPPVWEFESRASGQTQCSRPSATTDAQVDSPIEIDLQRTRSA